jgi:hypothetical protein
MVLCEFPCTALSCYLYLYLGTGMHIEQSHMTRALTKRGNCALSGCNTLGV